MSCGFGTVANQAYDAEQLRLGRFVKMSEIRCEAVPFPHNMSSGQGQNCRGSGRRRLYSIGHGTRQQRKRGERRGVGRLPEGF